MITIAPMHHTVGLSLTGRR